jgi:YhcH/YjgK/YiaL family protein
MIVDNIDQLKRYAVPGSEDILNFIADHDCLYLPDGEIEIKGRQLFVRVMSYTPKPAAENRFEIHRIYADLQFLASGAELMQTARMKDLTPLTEYDAKGDYHFFKASGATTDLIVQAGEFAVFYPNQAHRPSCSYEGQKGAVKKLVFKIKIN